MKIDKLSFEPDTLGTLIKLEIRVQEGVDLRSVFASVLGITADTIATAPKPLSLAAPAAEAPVATTRRSRTAPANPTPEAAEAQPSPETEPVSRRRRTPESAASPAEPSSEAGATGAVSRRRRVSGSAELTPAPEAKAELTDSDLSKAASEAARTLTPNGVKEVLATFGVETVNKLVGEDRALFMLDLDEAISKAKAVA